MGWKVHTYECAQCGETDIILVDEAEKDKQTCRKNGCVGRLQRRLSPTYGKVIGPAVKKG